jgi:hypothetical protein
VRAGPWLQVHDPVNYADTFQLLIERVFSRDMSRVQMRVSKTYCELLL